jgi:hypothetical protein
MEVTAEVLYDGKTFEEKIKSLSPMYAVVRVNSKGTLSGLVEHSFSMDQSSDRVNIFWSGKGSSILGSHDLDGKKWASENCKKSRGWFIVELGSDDCPIEVDYVNWLTGPSKFTRRNARFKTREGFDFSDQVKEATIRENYEEKHADLMKFVTVQDQAESTYKTKMREAQKVLDAETAHLQEDFKKIRNKYQSKAKSIAIEKGRCPKMPDGRYMNTGNSRITQYGLELKWFCGGPVIYTVPWSELF